MAAHAALRRGRIQCRPLGPAALDGQRAARREYAGVAELIQTRHLAWNALQRPPVFALPQPRHGIQEPARIRMQRLAEQFFGRRFFGQFAGVQHRHPVAEGCHHAQVMRHVQQRGVASCHRFAQQVQHGRFGGYV